MARALGEDVDEKPVDDKPAVNLSPSPSLGELSGDYGRAPPPSTSTPLPSSIAALASPPKDVTAGLADIYRRKLEEEQKVGQRDEQDRQRVEQAYKAEGIGPGTLEKWDAEKESKKHQYDPLEAFGSIGSVFGIIASAFTHAPMTNALNASAAAMNAIKAGKKEDYDRAYSAWKDNTDLALKRHQIQHEAFTDAVTLMQTNMAAGQAKLRTLAIQFDDKKTLFMLEHGMDKELFDMYNAREKSAIELRSAAFKLDMDMAGMSRLFALGYDRNNPTSPKSQEALVQFNKEKHELTTRAHMTPEQQAYAQYVRENKTTADERAEYIKKLRTRKDLTPDQTALNTFIEENDPTPEQIKQFVIDLKARGTGAGAQNIPGRVNSAEIQKRVSEYEAGFKQQGMGDNEARKAAFDQANREVALATHQVSPNKRDQLASRMDNISYSRDAAKDISGILERYSGAAGLFGKVNRTVERVGNVFGTNYTDRDHFLKQINYLETLAPRILTDSQGRPLSAEAGKISEIIGGKDWGSTTANTKTAMKELISLYNRMYADTASRWRGDWQPESSAPSGPPGAAPAMRSEPSPRETGAQPWLSDKIK